MKQLERESQIMLFQWMALESSKYPELRMAFAIGNGGSRHLIEAINLKRSGTKAGIPDLMLAVARSVWHGLFVEMKYGKNKLSKEQLDWMHKLVDQGYDCAVCYSFDEARKVILDYLKK